MLISASHLESFVTVYCTAVMLLRWQILSTGIESPVKVLKTASVVVLATVGFSRTTFCQDDTHTYTHTQIRKVKTIRAVVAGNYADVQLCLHILIFLTAPLLILSSQLLLQLSSTHQPPLYVLYFWYRSKDLYSRMFAKGGGGISSHSQILESLRTPLCSGTFSAKSNCIIICYKWSTAWR